MDANDRDLRELRDLLAQLTERVYRLERAAEIERPAQEVQPEPQPISAPPVLREAAPESVMEIRVPHIPPPAVPQPEPESGDLESRIGSQWLNRIGIVAVLIGVSFFLKYAFENNWIGPAGRIAIGLLAGIGIVVWSETFRNKGYLVFSWSLKAVGIGTLYLSLWAGFQMYKLFPAEVAFIGMSIVTVSTAVLAITEDAQILAAFALIGGIATPLLLSSGQNREVFLFSYVTLLDLGTLVLVSYRPWRKLLTGAFLGTVILYCGWYDTFYKRPEMATTLAFATIFFAIFAIAPLFAKERSAETISKTLLVIPLVNAAAYFLAVYVMLNDVSTSAIAWIAVVLAAVYLLLSREMQRHVAANSENARLLTLLHIALAVGFLTAAIPIKLASYWITIGWLIESGVLLYVAYRGASRFLKVLSLGALALGIGRLVLFDDFNVTVLVFNPRFAIYLIAIAVVAFAVYLSRTSEETTERTGAAVGIILINVLALLALNLEAHTYFTQQLARIYTPLTSGQYDSLGYRNLSMARDFTYSAIWMIYGAALMWIGFWKRSAFLRWQALILLAITIIKVFVFDTSQLEFGYRIIAFIALGALLMGVSFIYQRDWLKLSGHAQKPGQGSSASA
jgi:uncharacterized membrane protein